MKAWLRHNSRIFARLSPPQRIVQVCDSCSERTTLGYRYDISAGYELQNIPRHLIGFVSIAGVRHDKFCNGEEVAP